MQDKRKHLKDHIKSARSWLKKAEHSLEKDKDIEGDLSFMLAEAELKRAREIESKKATHGIFRLEKYTPFFLIFIAISAYFFYSQEEKKFTPPNTAISENTISKKQLSKTKEHIDKKVESPRQTLTRAVAPEETIAISQKQIENIQTEYLHEAREKPKFISEEEKKPREKMPSVEMQKLMNKAVKQLHAE